MRPVRRAGWVWIASCASSKMLRGLSVRAQARRISISLSFCVAGSCSLDLGSNSLLYLSTCKVQPLSQAVVTFTERDL